MKKGLLIIGVVMLLLLSSLSFADLATSNLEIGGKSIARLNPLGDDTADQEGDVAKGSFTIKNEGTSTVTGIDWSIGNVDSDIEDLVVDKISGDVTASDFPIDLAAGQTVTVAVTSKISESWDSLIIDEDEQFISAGKLVISGTGVNDSDVFVSAMVESGLSLDDVMVILDGDSYDFDDDEITNDGDDGIIVPGMDISLEMLLTNEFDRDSNIEFQDIQVDIDSDNNDWDIDDGSHDFDLDEGDDKKVTDDFDIDWDEFEDGDSVTITINAEVTDDNGATHSIELNFDIEVHYPEAEVALNDFVVSPSSVCAGDSVNVVFEIENTGTDDQDYLAVQIEQSTLRWDDASSRFGLDGRDNEDTETKRFSESFRVPTTAREGSYAVQVTIYYEDADGDDASRYETVTLTVLDCDEPAPTAPTTPSTGGTTGTDNTDSGLVVDSGNTNTGAIDTTAPVTGTSTIVATSKPKSNDALYVIGLILLFVLLIAVLVSLIMVLKK